MVVAITMLMVPTVVLANDALEAQSSIQPRWSYLYACDNLLDYASNISSGILIYGCTEVYEGHAGVEIQLQKWDEVYEKWRNTESYWEVYDEQGYAEAFEDDINVSAGVYRLSLTHTAYTTSGFPMESFTSYSNELRILASN